MRTSVIKLFAIFTLLISFAEINAQTPEVKWKFPLKDNAFGQPAAADIDNDGKLEIVFSTYINDGHIYALNSEDGSLLWKFNIGSCADAAPLIYDLNNDGNLEIVLHTSCINMMYCFNALDGTLIWVVNTRGTDSPPSVLDINNDGFPEIIDGDFGGYVSAFSGIDGSVIWEVLPEAGHFLQSAPAIADIDNDNLMDIVVGTYNLDSMCSVYAINPQDGSIKWKSKDRFNSIYHSPTLGDIDNDGQIEAVFTDYNGFLYCLDAATGTTKWVYSNSKCDYSLAPVTIADLNNDGNYEIIFFCGAYVNVVNGSGELIASTYMKDGYVAFRGGITVDVNNDKILDIVFGHMLGGVIAIDGSNYQELWNMALTNENNEKYLSYNSVISSDFDSDGFVDIFMAMGLNYTDHKLNYGEAIMITTNSKGGPDWLMFQNNPQRNPFIKSSSVSVSYQESYFGIISPNPAAEYIEIDMEILNPTLKRGVEDQEEIKIYNIFGELAMTYLSKGEGERIDISQLPAGIYFMKIGDNYGKFVVVR